MSRRVWCLVCCSAVAGTAAFFHRAAFTTDIFIGRDVLRGVYPLKAFWVDRVRSGDLPEWFPYDGLGQPFVGMLVSAVFHPSNLLFLVLSLGAAQKVVTLACYPAAFLGMFGWLRRHHLGVPAAAAAGLAYTFNGYVVGISNNTPYLMAAATVPLVFWATDAFLQKPTPGRALGAAGLIALILAGGEPQTFAMTCAFVLVLPLSRPEWTARLARKTWEAALIVGLGGLLSAPMLVPAVSLLADVSAGARPLDVALTWSVHPLQLLEVAGGALYAGDPDSAATALIDQGLLGLGKSAPWVESLHLGLPILIFAAVAAIVHRKKPRARLLVAAVVLLLLLVLGRFGGVYAVLFEVLPVWRPFRYPVKIVPLLYLCLAVAAAVGLDASVTQPAVRRRAALACAAVAGLCGVGFGLERAGGLLSRFLLAPFWATPAPREVLERLGAAFAIAAVESSVACGLIALILAGVQRPRLRAGLVVLTMGLHLFTVNEPHYQLGSAQLLEEPPHFAQVIRGLEGGAALNKRRLIDVAGTHALPEDVTRSWSERLTASLIKALTSDTPAIWGLEGSNNLMPATSARYVALCKQSDLWLWRYAGLFNTGYVTLPVRTFHAMAAPPGTVIAEEPDHGLLLLRKDDARPRAYLARARCVADAAAALSAVGSPEGLAADEAIVECGGAAPPAAGDLAGAEVTLTSSEPEQVVLKATSAQGAVLVLNDAFYRGWTASVNGAEARILPANYAVRGVLLGPGAHTVIFSYATPGLLAGALIAGATVLLLLALALLSHRKSAANAAAPSAEASKPSLKPGLE